MSVRQFLDTCYSELSNATGGLYFSPYSVWIEIQGRQLFNTTMTKQSDPSLAAAISLISAVKAVTYAILLTPILLPLTIATCALALAIDITALLTQLITYPIASVLDTVASPSL